VAIFSIANRPRGENLFGVCKNIASRFRNGMVVGYNVYTAPTSSNSTSTPFTGSRTAPVPIDQPTLSISVHTLVLLQISTPVMPAPGSQNAVRALNMATFSSRGMPRGNDTRVGIARNWVLEEMARHTVTELVAMVERRQRKDCVRSRTFGVL
jgi:hypothetical protein